MLYHYNHPTTPAGSLKPNLTQLERIDLKLKNIFCTATWMWQKKCRCKSRKQLRVKEAGYIYRLDNELHFMHGPYGCRFFIRSRSKRGCLKYLHAFEVSPPPSTTTLLSLLHISNAVCSPLNVLHFTCSLCFFLWCKSRTLTAWHACKYYYKLLLSFQGFFFTPSSKGWNIWK